MPSNSDARDDRARRSYEPTALESQPRISDLIPRSAWLLALLMLVWLLFVSGISYLHVQLGQGNVLCREPLPPFDFAGDAGLATWFASATLFLAAIGSLQVYVIRRHKTDDYRGTYRLWFWAAMWLVLASMEVTANLRGLVREAAVGMSGVELAGSGDLYWMLLIGLPSLCIGLRLAFEMKASKGAVVTVIAAGIAYAYAAVIHLGYVPVESYLITLHSAAALLAAHTLVLGTVAVYARHVVLEARGQQIRKQRKQKNVRTNKKIVRNSEDADSSQDPKSRRLTKKPTEPRESDGNDSPPPTLTSKSKRGKTQPAPTKPAAKKTPATKRGAKETVEPAQQDQPQESRKARREKQRKQKLQAEQQQQSEKQEKSTTQPAAQRPPKQKPVLEKPVSQKPAATADETLPDFEEVEEEPSQFRGLSKSERRKMRKLRRSQVRRAA